MNPLDDLMEAGAWAGGVFLFFDFELLEPNPARRSGKSNRSRTVAASGSRRR